MPIRAFWTLNTQIARLRSEEILEQADLMMLANANVSKEMIEEFRKVHKDRMGEPMVIDQVVVAQSAKVHESGFNELKTLLGGF